MKRYVGVTSLHIIRARLVQTSIVQKDMIRRQSRTITTHIHTKYHSKHAKHNWKKKHRKSYKAGQPIHTEAHRIHATCR